MRWILAKALDHACVPSRFKSLFYYLSVFLTPANSSRRSIQFPRSVSVVHRFPRLSFPCFQFIALASILQHSRSCRLRFLSFVYSSFHLVSLTRHPNNMSPIMTSLVSGLLPFVSASLRRLLSWGFSPCPPYHSWLPVFLSVGVQVGCCPTFLGLEIPAKLRFL